jgi:16S rRNA (adenine1518-N6/adenine1519-N6)-dimethyltransferase
MKKSRRRFLGQHFLKNPRLIQKIIQVIDPQKEDLIIEIGAGKGSLTLPLAKHSGRVVAIEKDPTLVTVLQKIIPPNVILVEDDILRLDLKKILADISPYQQSIKLVGNLPYSISSQIIIKAFDHKNLFPFWVFLLQEEMAHRFLASPGTKKFNPLGIMLQNYFEIRQELRINPKSFQPPPQVFSVLLSFAKRAHPLFPLDEEKIFHSFLKKCFAARRKTLANNLIAASFPPETVTQALASLNIPPKSRAEDLELETFYYLYNFFYLKKTAKKPENILLIKDKRNE